MASIALRLALASSTLLTAACSDETTADGAGGNGTGGAGGSGTTSTSAGIVTTECGTYDLSQGGDSVIPDDPSDPGIVAACADYCAKVSGSCGAEDRCNDACRASACDVCPGTWDPYVLCLAEAYDPSDACSCGTELPTCGAPPCSGERDRTTQCGG